jgi:hypothetical protein
VDGGLSAAAERRVAAWLAAYVGRPLDVRALVEAEGWIVRERTGMGDVKAVAVKLQRAVVYPWPGCWGMWPVGIPRACGCGVRG